MSDFKFIRTREVKAPTRANNDDAGVDCFFPTNLSEEEVRKEAKCNDELLYEIDETKKFVKKIIIPPHKRINLQSGIHVNIPKAHALIAFGKSGVATKKGLDIIGGVVDAGYSGEMHIQLYNTTDQNVEICAGEKIIQFILLPVNCVTPVELNTFEELYPIKTSRGNGGFGSSGQF